MLEPDDDRSNFRSGDIDLDRFFLRFAGQNQFRHHIGATYVADHDGRLAGFATVATGEIATHHLGDATRRRLAAYPLPILRLARLAVDSSYQGHGIGTLLTRAVLELSLDLRDRFGCVGVVVDAKEAAAAFYRGLGFTELAAVGGALNDRPQPTPLFLPIRQIAAARRPA